ncbi:MAG: hypothetical protein JW913_07575 [Chitinispirillaceae bacterium]|nr:hypothetical protein [Chitinispirillaceae bacterium]
MQLNSVGEMVRQCWLEIPKHYPMATLDEFVIIPNHLHGIIQIGIRQHSVGANNHSPLQKIHMPRQNHSPGNPVDGGVVDNGANNHSPLRMPNPHRICGTSKTVGSIVRGFKIGVTKRFHDKSPDFIVWQRNYYDHIIRDAKSFYFIRHYIRDNPAAWAVDRENHLGREIPLLYSGNQEIMAN